MVSTTPIHLAAHLSIETAVSLLVEKGADVGVQDSYALAPLSYAHNRHMAEFLLCLGASPTAIIRLGTITSLISWWGPASRELLSLYFGTDSGNPEWKLDELMDMDLSGKRYLSTCQEFSASSDNIRFLEQDGVNFICEDSSGRSLMHCVICSAKCTGIVLRDLDIENTTAFPWHLDWISLVDMAFLTSKFTLLRRRLPSETFRRILNLEPQRGWSPLCRAAALDLVNVIENCLSMGAAIDFEGAPLGSALMVACACGSLKAAKCLVQHGAAISYTGPSGGFTCAFAKTRSAAVRAWLLVGSFTDKVSITETGFWSRETGCPMELRQWSGIVQARRVLVGRPQMWDGESSIMYAERLGKWKKGMSGIATTGFGGLVFPVEGSP